MLELLYKQDVPASVAFGAERLHTRTLILVEIADESETTTVVGAVLQSVIGNSPMCGGTHATQ